MDSRRFSSFLEVNMSGRHFETKSSCLISEITQVWVKLYRRKFPEQLASFLPNVHRVRPVRLDDAFAHYTQLPTRLYYEFKVYHT